MEIVLYTLAFIVIMIEGYILFSVKFYFIAVDIY